jgi:para-aminobenzoate synthetase / 4-amino-4-deoxychorismate lyase
LHVAAVGARVIVVRARVFAAVAGADPQIDFAPAPAPDAALGVFETVLVLEGRPVEMDRHLERLAVSVRVLYDAPLPHELGAKLALAAAGHACARLRIDVAPSAATRPQIGVEPLDPALVLASHDVALATVRVSGGFGAHKLIDRRWLEQIEEAAGECVAPLLLSRSGALLETTRANVFLLRDGALATPPLDGSILPGVMRSVLLEQARRLAIPASELPLGVDDLRAAEIVLLSGSLRLIESARSRPGRRSAEAAARLIDAVDVRSR